MINFGTSVNPILRLGNNAQRSTNFRIRRVHTKSKSIAGRVVVTGLGIVSPLGVGHEVNWRRILNGECGIQRIQSFDVKKIPVNIAGTIPTAEAPYGFETNNFINESELKYMPKFIQYAIAASQLSFEDSNWRPTTNEEKEKTGVSIGVCIGGIDDIEDTSISYFEKGYHKVSPYYVPRILPNMASGNVSIKYGLRGPNHCVSTACSTGAHSIGDAYLFIKNGLADVMLAGASDASISPTCVSGFARARALTTKYNDNPIKASRPFDINRSGFVIAEGSGVIILESLEHALKRNAKIYAEIVGYGLTGDSGHLTAPLEDGDGAIRCMLMALKTAGVSPKDIDYINAHATSTQLGDKVESEAIYNVFKDNIDSLDVSSTKGSTGHLLGASGAVEAIYTILSVYHNEIPPTINLDQLDESIKINIVGNNSKTKRVNMAMSNSFGFGGTNCSLVFSSFSE